MRLRYPALVRWFCLVCGWASLLVWAMPSYAQTILAAGQIVFTGVHMTGSDQFTFAPLVNLAPGTEIRFTDNGWQLGGGPSGSFRATEGVLVYRAPGVVSRGTLVHYNAKGSNPDFKAEESKFYEFELDEEGDQLLAYQAYRIGEEAEGYTFLTALNMGDWGNATSNATSALPPGLTVGGTVLLTSTDAYMRRSDQRRGPVQYLRRWFNTFASWESGSEWMLTPPFNENLRVEDGVVPDADEYHALHLLYNQTNGVAWSQQWPVNWEAPASEQPLVSEMDWFGLMVVDGDVVALEMPFNNLQGKIPGSLSQLTQLQTLALNNNFLSGLLPDSLGQLAALQTMRLVANELTGPLPASWASLANLTILDLGKNNLSGPLPAGLATMTGLTRLNLAGNAFTGTVPVIAGPSAGPKRTLTFSSNDFTALGSYQENAAAARTVLAVDDNRLVFGALEPSFAGPNEHHLGRFDYANQRPIAPADTVHFTTATGTHSLHRAMRGSHNTYQWQRWIGSGWVDIPAATDTVLVFTRVVPADAGSYRLRVSNAWATDAQLGTRALYLDVLLYEVLAHNLPVDAEESALAQLIVAPDAVAPAPVDINFVRSWVPRVALANAARVLWAPVDSVVTSTTYLDGLGRPVQTVLRQASPQRRDLVQPRAYDVLGREPRQYLPYPDSLNGHGGYRYRALSSQQAFYRRKTPVGGGAGPLAQDDVVWGVARTGVAFAETSFEASPVQRVTAQGAVGEAWQLTAGHVMERLERPNTATDSVLRFVPGAAGPGYQGFYAPGELWGTDVADVHGPNEPGAQGYRTIEWKDREGQVVLRQVEALRLRAPREIIAVQIVNDFSLPVDEDVPPAKTISRWLRTAYAYDDFGRLRYVVQPEGTRRLLPLAVPTTWPVAVDPFVFHYRYDGRGRQIAKQVPGTDGETVVVFDQLDRPVLSQDAAQHTRREWNWTKYDALGRVILSGLVTRTDTLGQVSLQAVATADTATAHQYEQRTASTLYPQHYTTDQSFPKLGQQGFDNWQLLSITYYDDYNFNNAAAGTANASYDTSTDGQFPAGTAPVADALRTSGLTTRTRTRVLGVAPSDLDQVAWVTTTTFYDARARPVQVQTTNARKNRLNDTSFTDLLTTRLDFTGKVVQSVAVHQGPKHDPLTVAEFFTYDHTGRLLTTRQQLPGEAQPSQLASVAYNEIGQAIQKTMGTGRLAQQVDYTYNIRGWLTQLNDPYHPQAGDLFNLSLHYEQGFSPGYEQYNGNLTGQTWRGRDGVQRAYGYVYDPLNRLLQGDFVARNAAAPVTPNTAGLWKSELDHYRLSLVSYDDNGNILTLRRRGLLTNATHARTKQFGNVDDLTYVYAGNRLQAVDDAVSGNQLPRPLNYNGAPTSLAGDFQEGGTHLGQEYFYDANGNLTQDRNKGITGIAYNHLNLPRQIHFGIGADSIVFRYTAAGQKVAKLVYQTGKLRPRRTDYLGPYQYEDDSLRFFPHAEGRVLRFVSKDAAGQATTRYQREFTFKDHLGNLRLAYRAGQRRTYQATLEQDPSTHTRESQQFDSLSVSPPIAVPTGLTTRGSYAARLNAGGSTPRPLGPLTQFAVQKGDTVQASAFGLYPQATSNNTFSLLGFIASLLQPAPVGAPAGSDGSRRGGLPLLQVGLSSATLFPLLQTAGVPKGYLRVLSFNEDSVLVDQRTVQLRATALSNYDTLQTGPLVVQQNGYVSVYVGNESAADVYFDDVTIEHRQGLQVQENQYDPFGLDLAGLTRNTPGLKPLNQYKFNGKEFQSDLGLNWNHQDWRFFDTQLGRWHVTDPELENGQESWSPYSFGFNNAVRYADADGRCPDGCPPGVLPAPSFLERASKAMDLPGLLHDLRETPMIGPEMNMASGLITGLQELLTLATLTPTPTAQPQSTALPSDRAYSPPVAHAGSQAASQLSTTSSSRPARRVGQEAHKNSLSSNAPQHGYRILNKDGKVMEYGISSQALSKKGTSPRVASKLAEKYGNAAGYHGEVLNPSIQPTREGQTTREAAVEWEKTQVNDYARQNAAGEGPPRQDLPKPKL